MSGTINIPVQFAGSREQADLNYNSHRWAIVDEEGLECNVCASRAYHVAANYPCGVEPPRKEISLATNEITAQDGHVEDEV